ncbi:S8 family serine peptidase [Alteromonas sp. a30]|uniref:S8 family serine peptidase n=1 Tax=Alteromonas sp. a30 TaxID=2730917 RepID=UPI00227DA3CE|nr:S8 family serine peptidase [Alteromonas sp. a30]MCY7296177.1 S8 family serine peptidase [Alteromonas sp. a30]
MKNLVLKTSLLATALSMAFATSAESNRYIIQVDEASKGALMAMAKKHGGEINLESKGFIAATFNNMSLDKVKGMMNLPAVKFIEEDQIRRPMSVWNDDVGNPMETQITPYGYYQAQADQVTFNPNAGIKVCVIDSGLDISNTDFNWPAITGDNDPGTGNWFEHGGPHGTHVSGTIAAEDNSYGVIGMAPGVPLHIIKVFNADGYGYSSGLAAAAQRCVDAGADIINMSLGGGRASTTESNAFASFQAGGGLAIAAAGNDGNNTASYPAAYESVMMVGAADADNNIADFSQFPSCTEGKGKNATFNDSICVEVAAGGVNTLSTFPAGLATAANSTADGVFFQSEAMENSGTATSSTYFMGTAEAVDSGASGKICMIDRGNISFHDKVANCEASGGVGAVIINNEPGILFGTLGETNTTSIPSVGAALEDRSVLLAASNVTVDISSTDYSFLSGTSMATPTTSGVAALVWSNHPSCSGDQIRAALKATAEDQGAAGHDVNFGYGLVKAKAANDYLTQFGCAGN